MSTNVKRIVMAANGDLTGRAEDLLLKAVQSADITHGIDGGTRHFLRHEILPTIVTGDFDSLSPDERTYLQASGSDVILTPDQDYTDLEKALTIATTRHPHAEITIFGATGGRLDHQHSVLSTLTTFGRRHRIELIDSHGTTFHAQSGMIMSDDALVGRTISLISLGPVHGVRTSGVAWPLSDESLIPGKRDGTLNRITSTPVVIAVSEGDLLVHIHHAPDSARVAVVTNDQMLQRLIDIRWHVLRPNRPRSAAQFDIDNAPGTVHILASDDAGNPVGCATLAEVPDGSLQLRGMAVNTHHQGTGIGRAILAEVCRHAAAKSAPLWCNARLHAIPFYERNGWETEGDVFHVPDVGPHKVMRFRGVSH
ncbi:MAG: thiamine diphosphokinase [Armatimonadaceae bacterium]